ncbi:putative papain-like cysteine peptidase superfamily [Helianthus anomalus]
MALKKNFRPHGLQYPVLTCCYRMEPLTSEEAAQTCMSEPYRFGTYNSRLDSYSDELKFCRSPPNGHAMLITRMYTIRDQPNLLDHSFEVKNSYGKKWGVGGKV